MRVTHILVVCIEKVSSVVVGVLEPLKAIERQEKIEVRFVRTTDVSSKDIAWCDTVICVRGSEYADIYVVKAAKKAKRKIIYFLDDDLLDIPQNVSCTEYYNDKTIKRNIFDLFKLSDILWTVNPNILHKYKDYFMKAELVDACACEIVDYIEKESYPVKFIYAGSIDHEKIIRLKLRDPIKKICEEYGDKVKFTFIGVDPDLKEYSQVTYIAYIEDYYEYKKIMNESGFHISFAIIEDTPFYSCKYFNKYLEYSSIGAVGIYSNLEPYKFIIKNKENGILCNDDKEEWYEAMKLLIDDYVLRDKISKSAYDLLCERFTPNKVGEIIIEKIPELITFFSEEIEGDKIKISKVYIKKQFYFQRIKILVSKYGFFIILILPIKIIKKLFTVLKRSLEG